MADGNGYLNSSYNCLAELEDRVGGNSAIRASTRIRELEAVVFSQPMGNATPFFKGFAPVVEAISRAVLGSSYGKDNVFDRVWVRPVLIEIGFITEELLYEIQIWNAWQTRSVDLTSVLVTAGDGTNLDYPSLPFTLAQSNSVIFDLTIYKDGPPLQETLYRLILDGDSYYIEITGMRVIAVIPDIQWNASVSIGYGYQTIMYQEPRRFSEQRRPLVDLPSRSVKVSYLVQDKVAHTFFNLISYGHDKIFGVPIYNEKLIPSSIVQGSNIIQLTTLTDYMYNLKNNASFVVIVDHDNGLAEIKEITSISSNQIELATNMVETFNVASSYVYPVVLSIIHAMKFPEITDDIQSVSIDFEEYI